MIVTNRRNKKTMEREREECVATRWRKMTKSTLCTFACVVFRCRLFLQFLQFWYTPMMSYCLFIVFLFIRAAAVWVCMCSAQCRMNENKWTFRLDVMCLACLVCLVRIIHTKRSISFVHFVWTTSRIAMSIRTNQIEWDDQRKCKEKSEEKILYSIVFYLVALIRYDV